MPRIPPQLFRPSMSALRYEADESHGPKATDRICLAPRFRWTPARCSRTGLAIQGRARETTRLRRRASIALRTSAPRDEEFRFAEIRRIANSDSVGATQALCGCRT